MAFEDFEIPGSVESWCSGSPRGIFQVVDDDDSHRIVRRFAGSGAYMGTIRCKAMGLWVSGTFRSIAGHWLFFLSFMSIEFPCILAFSVLHDTDQILGFPWFRKGRRRCEVLYCWREQVFPTPGTKVFEVIFGSPFIFHFVLFVRNFPSHPSPTLSTTGGGGSFFSHQRHKVDFRSLHVFPKNISLFFRM